MPHCTPRPNRKTASTTRRARETAPVIVAVAVRRQEAPTVVRVLPRIQEEEDPNEVHQHPPKRQQDVRQPVRDLGRHEQPRDGRENNLPS